MAQTQKLAGLNTYGLCEWLTKKGIHDFVSHIQAWNYDGQMLVALTEDQLLSLEICEKSRRKLLKAIYPNSPAIATLDNGGNAGLLSRFRKPKNSQSALSSSAQDSSALDDEYDDDWDDDEFDDEFTEENGHDTHQDQRFDQITQQFAAAGIGGHDQGYNSHGVHGHDHSYNSQGTHLSPSHEAPLPALPVGNGHAARPSTAPKPLKSSVSSGSSDWGSNNAPAATQSSVSALRSTFGAQGAGNNSHHNAAAQSSRGHRSASSSQVGSASTPSSANKFSRSTSAGGNVPPTALPKQDMMNQEWYNPHMDRRAAESSLQQSGQDGSFVVRNSSKSAGEYSLSLIFHGHVRHLRIRRRVDNMFALGELKDGEKFFLSVQELVLYHRSEPITLQSGGVTCLTQPCRR